MQPNKSIVLPNLPVWLLASAMLFLSAATVIARDAPKSFSSLTKGLLPAVVNISTTQNAPETARAAAPGQQEEPLEDFFKDFFGGKPPQANSAPVRALGSGFIIDPDGYIVTNNHVVAKADEIVVNLADDRRFPARLIGTDPATDLALLKIDAGAPLPYVAWGDSAKTEIGDWLIAIGNPFGLGGTVTAGVLSARARDIQAGPYDDFLQTDAAINSGNSGGPLFDMNGTVVGVNTAIFSPSGGNVGIGFAIPASTSKPVIDQLRRNGTVRRGWLGVQIQPVTPEIAEAIALDKPRGALVAAVVADGPAAKSGLKAGDVVLAFAGITVDQLRDLPRAVANTEIGKKVPVKLWRDGQEIVVDATVAARKSADMAALGSPDRATGDQTAPTNALGMTLAPLNDDIRLQLEMDKKISGVVVTGVKPGSAAARQGIRPGDVIVRIGQRSISKPRELVDEIEKARKQGRSSALLRLFRAGTYRFAAVPV